LACRFWKKLGQPHPPLVGTVTLLSEARPVPPGIKQHGFIRHPATPLKVLAA